MLEAAAVIDHDDLRAGADQRRGDFLQGHGLARAGLAEDRDIMVAGAVLEWRPEEGLTAATSEQQMGERTAIIFAMQRRTIGTRRGQPRLEQFQPPKTHR